MEDAKECVIEVKDSGGDEASTEINVLWIQESIEQAILPTVDCKYSHHDFATIHRFSAKLRDGDESAYTPEPVSIGPYHHDNKKFEEMQAVKLKYLEDLIKWSTGHDQSPTQKYISSVSKRASEAKQQYSEFVNLKLEEFTKMMVVDGYFLLEFMLKSYLNEKKDQTNIVKTKIPSIMNDLLLVENQIPFFILKDLFEVYKQLDNNQDKNDDSFTIELLTLFCFSPGDRLDAQVAAKAFEQEVRSFHHLLHLYHISLNLHQDRSWKEQLEYEKIVDQMFYMCSDSNDCNLGNALWFIPVTIVLSLTLLIVFIFKLLWFVIMGIISFTLSKLWDVIKLLILLPLSFFLS